jgi:nitroreductase
MPTTEEILKLKKKDLKAPIIDVLTERWSPRVLSSEPIDIQTMASILEAGRWAPSAANLQPWFYYWGQQGTPGYEKLASTLTRGNQYARKAPVLMLACYLPVSEHGEDGNAQVGLGLSIMSMIVQTQSMGLYAHPMAGFDKGKVKEVLDIPDEHVPHVMIAIAKIGDYAQGDPVFVEKDNKPDERKEVWFRKV